MKISIFAVPLLLLSQGLYTIAHANPELPNKDVLPSDTISSGTAVDDLILSAASLSQYDVMSGLNVYQSALDECKKALALQPKDFNVTVAKSRCLYEMATLRHKQGNEQSAKQLRSEALSDSAAAVELAPDNLKTLLWRGECLRKCAYEEGQRGNLNLSLTMNQTAVEYYDKSIMVKPSEEAYRGKGAALSLNALRTRELSDSIDLFERAEESFKQAIDINNRSASTYSRLGLVQANLSRCFSYISNDVETKKCASAAVRSLKKAISLDLSFRDRLKEDLSIAQRRASGSFVDKRIEENARNLGKALQSPSTP
jgi:tetratricopeptide (TPR) repeat protein